MVLAFNMDGASHLTFPRTWILGELQSETSTALSPKLRKVKGEPE